MTDTVRFELSPKFINTVLDNSFGIPTLNYQDTKMYVGLGIEFDNENFVFSKEPVSKWYTVLSEPVMFSEPINGIIRNTNALSWNKAQEDWTEQGEQIQYIGLYYRFYNDESGASGESENTSAIKSDIETEEPLQNYEYELIAVLPLTPAETVLKGERMVLNANSIQLKLSNR